MFDCHVHSNFSGDSQMPVEKACEAAINIGLDGIAFTDHLDLDYPDYNSLFNIDFNSYSNIMDRIKNDYIKKIKVIKGIEVGIQPHVISETVEIVEKYGFDFVIASIHVIDRVDPYTGEYYKGKTKQKSFSRYLQEIEFGVRNFKNYDVIGHIGYIRRYCSYDDRSLRYDDFCDLIDSILKNVILDGKGIEINSQGYRGDLFSPIPDFDIVKRYKELGGEIITIGSDAHYPEHVGHSFDVVREMLVDMDIKYTAHFENRKPVFDKL
ncbi:MAG: histidinol-phosphatase HisJ family protein [Clostridia bacterium]|nr:histidinol-phosphatase HisJ family protein [Clostridia bacterium]